MSYDKVRADLAAFDKMLATLGVKIGDDCPIRVQLATMREFLADQATMTGDALTTKWQPRLNEFYDAAIVVGRLTDSAMELRDQPAGPLKSLLRKALGDKVAGKSLTQDFLPQQAKDFFYELNLAATMKKAGFKVELREPDVVVSGGTLSKPLGIAGKYPSSEDQLHTHISKGYKQIAKQGLDGFVAIGLDLLVFKGMPKFMDFRQGNRSPEIVLGELLDGYMKELVTRRASDYPSEKPADGILLTVSLGGIIGEPAGIVYAHALELQCDASNPILQDLLLIKQAVSGLNRR